MSMLLIPGVDTQEPKRITVVEGMADPIAGQSSLENLRQKLVELIVECGDRRTLDEEWLDQLHAVDESERKEWMEWEDEPLDIREVTPAILTKMAADAFDQHPKHVLYVEHTSLCGIATARKNIEECRSEIKALEARIEYEKEELETCIRIAFKEDEVAVNVIAKTAGKTFGEIEKLIGDES